MSDLVKLNELEQSSLEEIIAEEEIFEQIKS